MVSSVRIGHSPFSQNKKNNLKGLRRVGPSHNSKMAVRNAKHIFQWKISVENLSRLITKISWSVEPNFFSIYIATTISRILG